MPSIVSRQRISAPRIPQNRKSMLAGALAAPPALPSDRPRWNHVAGASGRRLDAPTTCWCSASVYAGRVLPLLRRVRAPDRRIARAVILVGLYGNRDFDDALLETADLLGERGFDVVAAGAFIGEHSLTGPRGNRPPRRRGRSRSAALRPKGWASAWRAKPSAPTRHQKPPLQRKLKPRARRAPHITDACTSCSICAARCPLGIIGGRSRAHRRGLPPLLRLREKLPRRREMLLEPRSTDAVIAMLGCRKMPASSGAGVW